MSEWSIEHAWKACVSTLRGSPGELQMKRVACPRNHFNLQREVASFRRPLRICGGSQHRRQIPFQLDLQLALVGRQDDAVDEATQRLRDFRAGFWMLQGLSQCGDPKGREEVPVQISRLLHAHEIVLKEARTMARRAAEAGDDGTNDLIVSDVIRQNELQVWFVAEHVVDMPLVQAV
jgi:hypothetical protein